MRTIDRYFKRFVALDPYGATRFVASDRNIDVAETRCNKMICEFLMKHPHEGPLKEWRVVYFRGKSNAKTTYDRNCR